MKTVKESGFTLYELLVAMLIAGVIFGLGTPNLLEFTRNNRMAAAANDLTTIIANARSTAATRRQAVTICASPDPLADTPVCDADLTDPDTRGGFVSWVDEDADAVVDAGEPILSRAEDPDGITLLGDSGYLQFGRNGYVRDAAAAGTDSATEWLLCDPRGNVAVSGSLSAARGLRIDPSGRTFQMRSVPQIVTLSLECP